MTFEQDIHQAIKSKVLSEINKTQFTTIAYNEKKPIPQEFINKVWADVDWDAVTKEVKSNLEIRICNSIVANMETEIKTDVKKLLSVDGVRQKLRMEVYPKLMNVLNKHSDY